MEHIGILHLSDIHFCKENQETIVNMLDRLKDDLSMVCGEEQIAIRAICLTGDLINRGCDHVQDFNCFIDVFLLPLIDSLGLDFNGVFVVPGNHEVDTSVIDEYVEDGLAAKLADSVAIQDFQQNKNPLALQRLDYFREVARLLCDSELVYENDFCRCYQKEIQGMLWGFACLNSAWRSSGKGDSERGKMIVGTLQVECALNALKNVQVKVCLVHHPLDWLIDCDHYDIEKLIYQFDLVLNGHIHSLDSKRIIAYQGQCVISTCGKFFPTKDFYNGYSIVSVDPNTLQGKIFLRQYYAGARNCFDKCLQLYSDGVFDFSLGAKDPILVKSFETAHDIQPGFLEYANSFFVSNIIMNRSPQTLEKAFVAPPLGKQSEYRKETMYEPKDFFFFNDSEQFYSLENLVSNLEQHLLVLGRKEYGKTTLIHYMVDQYLRHYYDYGRLPVIIDCTEEFNGKRPIERKCEKFFTNFGTGSLAVSLNEIAEIAGRGKFVFFFDNFETAGEKELSQIRKFVETYPDNRFIYSAIETVDTAEIDRAIETLPQKIERVYIHSLGKQQVRTLACSVLSTGETIDENVVDRALLCFHNTNLPKTPFVVLLVLSLCKESSDFVPINESSIMENFLETLLEKTASDAAKTSSYDYRVKEDFLCYLVGKMHEKDQYYFFQQEFEEYMQEYHSKKGWAIKDTKFDTVFFEKGILYRHAGIVAFRYSCMAHYYLAKLALRSPELLAQMFTDDHYLSYYYELNYLTGLERERLDIYEKISGEFEPLIEEYKSHLQILDDYGIQTDFSIEHKQLEEALSTRMTMEQSDHLVDNQPYATVVDSSQITKGSRQPEQLTSRQKFIPTLMVYAMILKNSEMYDFDIKQRMVSNLTEGFCIALALLIEAFHENMPKMVQQAQEHFKKEPAEGPEPSQEEIQRIMGDTIKIVMPLVIENIAFENAGSAKLKNVILPMLRDESRKNSFSQCLLLFLYCDLRISGCLQELSSFVSRTSSKDLLTIVLFKAMFYYKTRYFPPAQDNMLENIIAEINLKLQNVGKLAKSHVLRSIRKQRPMMGDII